MKKLALIAASLSLSTLNAYADSPTPPTNPVYKNVYISYFSPDNMKAMADLIASKKLHGMIMWEFRGDMPASSDLSLLKTANNEFAADKVNPMVMGYYSDWSVYSPSRAIASDPYPVPGSTMDKSMGTKNDKNREDFLNKVENMTVVNYAFLEAQTPSFTYYDKNGKKVVKTNDNFTKTGGTLYFDDPWSDLDINDNGFCENNIICTYVPTMQGNQYDKSVVSMGNFRAFSALQHKDGNPLGKLSKVFSVGGYGHDDSFESMFVADAAQRNIYFTNFVNSAKKIIDNYNLDGIDLDYENPSMTAQQSQYFQQLVSDLHDQLVVKDGKQLYVTVLSSPLYLQGKKPAVDKDNKPYMAGFAKDALVSIANNVTALNLMTYDFHGAFNYAADGSGKTGFLTNISNSNNSSPNSFSVNNSLNAVQDLGIDLSKVSVGVPAYGRALQGISDTNKGLDQTITNSPIPRGNLDDATCSQDITTLSGSSCSGSFEYSFINNEMLGKGFTQTVWPSPYDGTTAYAPSWQYQVKPNPKPAPSGDSHSVLVGNTGTSASGDLGIQVTIGKFTSDYVPPTTGSNENSKSYDPSTNPSTKDITSTTVHWFTYQGGPSGDCSQKLDITKNQHIMVKVDKNGNGVCDIKPTS